MVPFGLPWVDCNARIALGIKQALGHSLMRNWRYVIRSSVGSVAVSAGACSSQQPEFASRKCAQNGAMRGLARAGAVPPALPSPLMSGRQVFRRRCSPCVAEFQERNRLPLCLFCFGCALGNHPDA